MSLNRIALFCHNLEINGANMFLLTLARTFYGEYEVHVFAPREGAMRSRFENENVTVRLIDELFDFNELCAYSAVIVNTLMMSRVAIECNVRNLPHILVVHETWNPDNLSYYLDTLWHIEGVESEDILNALRSSQHVVFPSRHLHDVYRSLVGEDRVSTIYCTIEMEQIDEYRRLHSRQNARASLGVSEQTVLFLHMGTVTRRKSQMSTLQAFAKVHQQAGDGVDMKLFFVGARRFRPGEREYIEEIIAERDRLGLTDHVTIFDVQEDPYRFYLAGDILVHPSVNEVLPLVILEACYCQLPVIVSQLDGMPEIIRHQQEGLLVNPYDINCLVDAMSLLAMSPELRGTYGRQARISVARQHSVDTFNQRYRGLVDEIRMDLFTDQPSLNHSGLQSE